MSLLKQKHNLKVQAYLSRKLSTDESMASPPVLREKTPPKKSLLSGLRKPRNLIVSSKIGNF